MALSTRHWDRPASIHGPFQLDPTWTMWETIHRLASLRIWLDTSDLFVVFVAFELNREIPTDGCFGGVSAGAFHRRHSTRGGPRCLVEFAV